MPKGNYSIPDYRCPRYLTDKSTPTFRSRVDKFVEWVHTEVYAVEKRRYVFL